MPARLSTSALLIATLAACGGSPTGPSSSPPRGAAATTVDRSEVVIAGIGESATLTASADGQATTTPSLSLAAESRWLSEAAVLDADALAGGRIVAAGAGVAELDVRAFGASPARVKVRVEPAQPLVASATAEGERLVLRGYRMDRAGAVVVGTDAATRVSADSATLTLAIPAVNTAACVQSARRDLLSVAGASVLPGLRVERRHAGELRLKVGETVRLSGEAGCLRLAPVAGAEYALAYLDARTVQAAASAAEPMSTGTSYGVAVAEAGQAAPAFSISRSSSVVAVDQPRRTVIAGSPVLRAAPWAAGDRFDVNDPAFGGTVPARVVKVYGGHLVLAVAEDVAAAGGTDAFVARADTAFAALVQHGYPLFKAALSGSAPVTSSGSGQLLVIARPTSDGVLGSAVTVPNGTQRFHYVLINSGQTTTAAGLLKTLAHEVTHSWQERWAAEARPAGAAGVGAPAWAVEGNADLLAAAVLRRALSISLSANWDWAARLSDPASASYAVLAASARGELTAGYASSASFQTDLVARLVRAGLTEEAALAEVSRGVLEGWYGFDRAGARHAGLSARMGRRLGSGWNPTDALLAWALSQAADDLTPNQDVQNPVFARVSTAGEASAQGWLPAATLRTGASAVRSDATAPATVSGNAVAVTRRYGSPGFLRIEDGGIGGVYTLSASANGAATSQVAWALVRVR